MGPWCPSALFSSKDKAMCSKILLLLYLMFILCDAQEKQPKEGGRAKIPFVREVTNEFTRRYHQIPPTIMMFYTPWCYYSHELQPVMAELAKILAGSVDVCKIDISLYSDIARFFQIKETPTIAYLSQGKTLVYEQELTVEGILQFAAAAYGPDVYGVNNATDLDYWTGNYSVVFLMVYDQEIAETWHKVYVSVATQKKANLRFLYTNESVMVQNRFGIKQFPAFLAIKEGQVFVYDEPVTYHAMSIWIDNERLPTLVQVNISTAKQYIKLPAGKKMFLSLLDRKSDQKVYNIIKRLAEGRRFHSGYQFAWTEDDSLLSAITGSSSVVKPLLLVWEADERRFYPLQDNSELTAKLITTFLLDVSKQKIESQVAATSYFDLLENLITMIYGMCWTMYIHRPFLSFVTVVMPLLGIYLLFCGPKKRPAKKSRLLHNRPRHFRQESRSAEVDPETLSATASESGARRRNMNRTTDDDNNPHTS